MANEKISMFTIAVTEMAKAKAFYATKGTSSYDKTLSRDSFCPYCGSTFAPLWDHLLQN